MFAEPLMGYLLLLLLFALFFSGSFVLGWREWRRPCDAVPLSMDVDYVRTENYFGRSFRAKVQEWRAESQPNGVAAGPAAPVQRVTPGGERLLVLQGGRLGSDEGQDEIVYSERDLTLARRAVFHREIFCQGRLETEFGVQLQSAAGDGDLVLGEENEVARWVDAHGKLLIRRGTVVRSRACSSTSIELEPGVSAQSLYAPCIATAGGAAALDTAEAADSIRLRPTLPNGPPGVPGYLEGLRCSRLEPGTWLVPSDLRLPPATQVDDNLIVKGTLTAGSHCLFSRDVKANRLDLGKRNEVRGNLTAEGYLLVGEESCVERNVTAETVRLARGARIGRPNSPAAISASGEIILERNVTVCGKLTAGQWIRTV